ncbi:MAG: hypothetical protein H0U73_02105 [Tatlockia sp.]|nr:hypothetical protein [Tatlockia sp.]
MGDILIIGLDSDSIAKHVKGENRPLRVFQERCLILSQFQSVDLIFKTDCAKDENLDEYFDQIYQKLKPDIVATNVKAGKYGVIKRSRAKRSNIKFEDIETDYTLVTTQA